MQNQKETHSSMDAYLNLLGDPYVLTLNILMNHAYCRSSLENEKHFTCTSNRNSPQIPPKLNKSAKWHCGHHTLICKEILIKKT